MVVRAADSHSRLCTQMRSLPKTAAVAGMHAAMLSRNQARRPSSLLLKSSSTACCYRPEEACQPPTGCCGMRTYHAPFTAVNFVDNTARAHTKSCTNQPMPAQTPPRQHPGRPKTVRHACQTAPPAHVTGVAVPQVPAHAACAPSQTQ